MKKILALIIAIFINLLYLNWIVISQDQKIEKIAASQPKNTTITNNNVLQNNNSCSAGCISQIKQATAAATAKTQTTTTINTGVSEFFVPLGSGSVASTEWQAVTGAQAYVDTRNYGRIKKVTFEASVNVPTGNETVNVMLFNMTAGHPVWNSTVFFSGGTNAQLLISQPITLDPGNNLYQVQMQTQLTFPANLNQARIHILTN